MTTVKYPLQAANGDIMLSPDSRATTEAVLSALQTRKGERVWRNNYGSDLEEFQLVSNLPSVLQQLKQDVVYSTTSYPQYTLELQGSINEDGQMDVLAILGEDEEVLTSI